MKNIKILIASCLMLVCAANVSAQWRFGVEWNYLMMQQFHYDSEGVFQEKKLNAFGGMTGFFTAEYILPRKWTPNWMALSIKGQLGGGSFSSNSKFEDAFYVDEENINDFLPAGIMIPIDVELKLLLNNTTRFFVNGGIPNMINVDGGQYCMGYEFGAGFEFGFFRIGYKNVNLNKTFISANRGNKYNNIHTFTASFIFNGNRFLKKNSSLKAY